MIATLLTVLSVTAALLALIFVVRYTKTTWYKTEEGRHTMAFMTVCVILLVLSVVSHLLNPPVDTWNWVKLAAFGALNWILGWRVLLLFSYQRPDGKSRKQGQKDDSENLW